MEDERQPVDLVFVVGPIHSKAKRAISRFMRRLLQSSNDFTVASVYFTPKHDPSLGNNVFLSRIIDFSDTAYPSKIGDLPQVQGNPLQHVNKLSFRDNAIKICFLISDTLPFHDSYYEDNARQENNESDVQSTAEEVYNEDPLLTCHHLAALGVALYCIGERNHCATFCSDMYTAFTYITGGQLILLDKITSLQKTLWYIIMEELSLEKQVGQLGDYLCVAWHSWGRMKARVPANVEVLTDNILNHFHNTNIMMYEVLVGGNAPEKPSKLAKEIAKVSNVNKARSLSNSQENWSTELNWLPEEHEVIPGYKEVPLKKESIEVSVSKLKLVTRNQVSRMLLRVSTRRPNAKQLSHNPTRTTPVKEKQDTIQSNSSIVSPSCDLTMDDNDNNDNNNKLLEETVLKTKKYCKPHETIVINCQKIALCSIA